MLFLHEQHRDAWRAGQRVTNHEDEYLVLHETVTSDIIGDDLDFNSRNSQRGHCGVGFPC